MAFKGKRINLYASIVSWLCSDRMDWLNMWTRGRVSVESKASKYIISSISPEFNMNCDFVKSKHGINCFEKWNNQCKSVPYSRYILPSIIPKELVMRQITSVFKLENWHKIKLTARVRRSSQSFAIYLVAMNLFHFRKSFSPCCLLIPNRTMNNKNTKFHYAIGIIYAPDFQEINFCVNRKWIWSAPEMQDDIACF